MSKSICNILSWNVRSILGKVKLENFLQILEDRKIDIACICETWFDSQKGAFSSRIREMGYEMIHANRESMRAGGVAIMYKDDTGVKPGCASSEKYVSFEFSHCHMKKENIKYFIYISSSRSTFG